MTKHSDLTGANVHVPFAFSYVDEAAREAASGFVSADVGKLARQLDDNSLWILTAVTPTWAAVGGGGGGGRELIESIEPSGTGTITFSSIPGTFTALEIEYIARSTKSADIEAMNIYFNNDTTDTNYRHIRRFTYAAGTPGADGGDLPYIDDIPAATALANNASRGIIKIPFYAESVFHKNCMVHATSRRDASSVHEIFFASAVNWENAAAITRIDLKLASGNFVSPGTIANLYGLP